MAVYKTYEQVGLKEDVSSLISDITPSDCPFYSMIKTEKVHNRVYQYQTDTIAAAGSNAQLEGFTASAGTAIPTTMISGNTQVLAKIFEVSESLRQCRPMAAHLRPHTSSLKHCAKLKVMQNMPWSAHRTLP